MIPWLLFGAGGKGVGARTLELALAEQRPIPPRNWRNKAYRFLQATPVMPA